VDCGAFPPVSRVADPRLERIVPGIIALMSTPLRSTFAFLLTLALLLPLLALWFPEGPDNPASAAASPAIAGTRWLASLLVAATAALLAVAMGAALSSLLSLTDFPQPGLWATLALLPFACPPAVWALAQMHCYGSGGLVEMAFGDTARPVLTRLNPGNYASTVLVLTQIHTPLAMLILGRGLGRIHWAGFEAALQCLSRKQLLRWLAGALRGELCAAFLLAFALGLGNFAVPHVLQCRLYPIEVYSRVTNYLDGAGAVRAAVPLLLTTLLAAAALALAERGGTYANPTPERKIRIRLGRRTWLAGSLLLIYLTVTALLPLVATVSACKSLSHFLAALRDAASETENTLWISATASVLACACGMVVAIGCGRRTRSLLGLLATLPLGVPALLVGLAFARFFSRTWPLDLTGVGDSGWLVILGLTFRSWPFTTRVVATGQRQMARDWQEMARLCRQRPWRRWTWISGPLVIDQLATGAILAYVLAVGEVEISQMLCAPGEGTLALRLFTFLHFGPSHVAASLAIVQGSLAILPVLVYYLAFDRCLQVV
jgi:iron(III) transport system permease protein